MGSIAKTEDFILARAESLFGRHVRFYEALPSALNIGLLKELVKQAPGVYVAFLGGRPGIEDAYGTTINARFDVYLVTRHAGNDQPRRRGDSTTIGAYELVQRLIPNLHQAVITDVDCKLRFMNCQNLFSMQVEEAYKAAMYAITFEAPNMPMWMDEDDMESLDDFDTFHADYDIPEHESSTQHQAWANEDYSDAQPNAQDDVQLNEQE